MTTTRLPNRNPARPRCTEGAQKTLWRAALLGKPIDPVTEQPKRAGLKKLPKPDGRNCARYRGFSLHANTTVGPAAHDDRYRLVKYLHNQLEHHTRGHIVAAWE